MTTPFMSPCTNHKDNCPLDIKKLKEAIKHRYDYKPYERMSTAEEHYKKLVLVNAPEPAIKAAKEDLDKASKAYYESAAETSANGKTMLYTIRAHHRGRLHRQKTRQPDGTFLKFDLELQDQLFLNSSWAKMLKRFLKAPAAVPNQAV
jgi:hypothetical protein